MFESGEVKRAEGGRATVVMRPAGGCAGCNRCAGKNGRELIADNAIGAKAGDIVSVEISERSRLAAAVTVFPARGARAGAVSRQSHLRAVDVFAGRNFDGFELYYRLGGG